MKIVVTVFRDGEITIFQKDRFTLDDEADLQQVTDDISDFLGEQFAQMEDE